MGDPRADGPGPTDDFAPAIAAFGAAEAELYGELRTRGFPVPHGVTFAGDLGE